MFIARIFVTIASILALTTSAVAANPHDPIGWEVISPLPTDVVSGNGPYSSTFVFTNQTGLPSEVPLNIQLTASPASEFSIGQNTCTRPLPNNAGCQVTINFNPSTPGSSYFQVKASFALFSVTVPRTGVNVQVAVSPGPPAPPKLPTSTSLATKLLMWSLPGSGISYPVYVYKSGTQVNYIPGAAAQAFIGAYPTNSTPPAPGGDDGTYNLYYKIGSTWYGCDVALLSGKIVSAQTTCKGTVINQPKAATSNVYTLAMGNYSWPAVPAPPGPISPTGYTNRSIQFINNTNHTYIRIQGTCKDFAACKNGYDVSLPNSGSNTATITVGAAAMTSGAFHVSGFCDGGTCGAYPTGPWVATGGTTPGDNGGFNYYTKVEPTFLIINGGIPTGASNVDASAVDGYNIGVKLYPTGTLGGNYCTYTVPPENSNVLGAGLYDSTTVLAKVPQTANLQTLCQNSSQLPASNPGTKWILSVINGSFAGCMSPCTYAAKHYGVNSGEWQLFCCKGAHDKPSTCIMPSGKQVGANTSTYTSNVYQTFQNVYPFAYGDAGSDYACPADTSFVAEFTPTA